MARRSFSYRRTARLGLPADLSDEQLAELAADGIESAFAALVLRHRGPLVCHCERIVGRGDAEEVVQDALFKAYVRLAAGDQVRQVGPWLRVIAHNTALNLLRTRSRRPLLIADDAELALPQSDALAHREALRVMVDAVGSLPPRQRDALVLREFEGRSYAEIADRLGTSNGSVRQLLSRARAAVRSRLEALAGLEPAWRWLARSRTPGAGVARMAGLSGGCALTIRVCSAVLPGALGVAGVSAGAAPHARARAAAHTQIASAQASSPLRSHEIYVSGPASARGTVPATFAPGSSGRAGAVRNSGRLTGSRSDRVVSVAHRSPAVGAGSGSPDRVGGAVGGSPTSGSTTEPQPGQVSSQPQAGRPSSGTGPGSGPAGSGGRGSAGMAWGGSGSPAGATASAGPSPGSGSLSDSSSQPVSTSPSSGLSDQTQVQRDPPGGETAVSPPGSAGSSGSRVASGPAPAS